MDEKSEKTIFIGYSEKSKAYKLYNPITKKTIVSKDVVFEEEKDWNDSSSQGNDNPQIVTGGEGQIISQQEQGDHEPNTQTNTRTGSPMTPTTPQTSVSTNTHRDTTGSPPRRGYRNPSDIYNDPRSLDFNDTADFALFSDAEPVSFEEAWQDKKMEGCHE